RRVMTMPVVVVAGRAWARAEPINLRMLSSYSRATSKTDAPLETGVGNTAGPAVTGNLTVDPFKPATASGTIKVDLTTLNTGVANRDAAMQGPQYLDIAANEANKFAVFEITSIELARPRAPGKDVPAKIKGISASSQK